MLHRFRHKYKQLIEEAIPEQFVGEMRDISYWQRRLFVDCLFYALPVSIFVVIPSSIIQYQRGYTLIAILDLLSVAAIIIITFNRRLNLARKKQAMMTVLIAIAVVTTERLGSFDIGCIYLMAASVFMSLLFSTKAAYASLALNALIYAGFACIIGFKLFHSPLVANYRLGIWMLYSINFMFINVMIVLQIRRIISGMEETIQEGSELLFQLKKEIIEKNQRNRQLKESGEHYRRLFFLSPSPMGILDRETLRFLQVNDAALQKYGYLKDEFLGITIESIRSEKNAHEKNVLIRTVSETDAFFQKTTRHSDKNGGTFDAEVTYSSIPFQGKNALLIIIRDITSQLEHIRAIEKQNEKLREIAFMQSHIVRAPLSRIIALHDLITEDLPENRDIQLFSDLSTSVRELDDVIRTIVSHTEEIVIKKG